MLLLANAQPNCVERNGSGRECSQVGDVSQGRGWRLDFGIEHAHVGYHQKAALGRGLCKLHKAHWQKASGPIFAVSGNPCDADRQQLSCLK